jgi:hypothetical protein
MYITLQKCALYLQHHDLNNAYDTGCNKIIHYIVTCMHTFKIYVCVPGYLTNVFSML